MLDNLRRLLNLGRYRETVSILAGGHLGTASVCPVHHKCRPGDLAKPGCPRAAQTLGEVYSPVDVVSEFAYTMRNELDYRHEGPNADRFRAKFASATKLFVPNGYWQYTPHRGLVMELIHSIKINDLDALERAHYGGHHLHLPGDLWLVSKTMGMLEGLG